MSRTNWTDPSWPPRIRNLLARGYSLKRIAVSLNVDVSCLRQACQEYGFNEAPAGWLYMGDLAAQMGVTSNTALFHARKLPEGVRRWGERYIITQRAAAHILAEHQPTLDAPPAGYLSIRQIADRWQMSFTGTIRRLRGVPYVRVQVERMPQKFYAPHDFLPLTPHTYRQRPRHLLTRKQIAAELGVSVHVVTGWLRRAPLAPMPWRGRGGRTCLYDPAEVQQWLATHHPDHALPQEAAA